MKKKRRSEAARLGCINQLVLMGILWGIFVGFNTLVRKYAPHLEFRLGQVSVLGFALAAAELFVAWWVSLRFTNWLLGEKLARAIAKEEEELERLEAEEAARKAAAAAAAAVVEAEAAKEEQ